MGGSPHKSSSGRRAVRSLIHEVGRDTHLVVHHKKYALACKFFEYIFEPVLAEQNSIYYEAGFHRFVANLLYFWTEARQGFARTQSHDAEISGARCGLLCLCDRGTHGSFDRARHLAGQSCVGDRYDDGVHDAGPFSRKKQLFMHVSGQASTS